MANTTGNPKAETIPALRNMAFPDRQFVPSQFYVAFFVIEMGNGEHELNESSR